MKLALISQLLAIQILTNDVQMLILCLSYFITTLQLKFFSKFSSSKKPGKYFLKMCGFKNANANS